jgi:hypothetical protein
LRATRTPYEIIRVNGLPARTAAGIVDILGLMPTEAGEYIVGAYLQHKHDCGIILYNVRPPGGKLAGLRELDVIGLNLPEKRAFLCEVTTHLHGMRPQMLDKMPRKHLQQREYAAAHLSGFDVRYMLWSPLVTATQATKLQTIGFEVVVNSDFKRKVMELREIAKVIKYDTGNPFMRTLQILEQLRG